jgi:hypothetical protein
MTFLVLPRIGPPLLGPLAYSPPGLGKEEAGVRSSSLRASTRFITGRLKVTAWPDQRRKQAIPSRVERHGSKRQASTHWPALSMRATPPTHYLRITSTDNEFPHVRRRHCGTLDRGGRVVPSDASVGALTGKRQPPRRARQLGGDHDARRLLGEPTWPVSYSIDPGCCDNFRTGSGRALRRCEPG